MKTNTEVCSLLMSFFSPLQEGFYCQVYVSENILYSAAAYLEFLAQLLANTVYGMLKVEVK